MPLCHERSQWLLHTAGWEPGPYDIIIGVSTRGLHLKNIDSITFTISTNFKSFGPSEIIHRQDLATMLSTFDTEIMKWKLHRQLRKRPAMDTMIIMMEIRMTSDALSARLDPGYLKLHYVDFCALGWRDQDSDPTLRMHQPYIWSLNVCNKSDHDSQNPRETQKEIVHYAVSGDGSYVATLSIAGDSLHIELWDTSRTRKSRMDQGNLFTNRPHHCAEMVVPVAGLQEETARTSFMVSISWDASQIALTDASALAANPKLKVSAQSVFTVYRCHERNKHGSTVTLVPSEDYQHCSSLRNFHGYGKYHITATENQDVMHELFITCDNKSISVYSAFRRWSLLRTITIDQPQDDLQFRIPASWRLIDGLRGRYFAWEPNVNDEVLVWDLELGSLKSYALWQRFSGIASRFDDAAVAFSSDGSMIAILREGCITSHIAASGTVLGSFVVPAVYGTIKNLQFILNNTQLLVDACTTDEDFGQGHVGLVLDAKKMVLLNNFLTPGEYMTDHLVLTQQNRTLYAASGSTLDFICIDDRIVLPYSLTHIPTQSDCDGQCENDLVPLTKLPKKFTSSSSGLCFRADIHPAGQSSELSSVTVSVSNKLGVLQEKLVIPPIQDRFDEWEDKSKLRISPWRYITAVFLEACSRLVVASRFMIMVWSLPTTPDGDFNLLLCWCLIRDRKDVSYTKVGLWRVCGHQQLFACARYANGEGGFREQIVMRPRVENVLHCEHGSSFVKGAIMLINNIQDADRPYKEAVLRYIGEYINSYPDPTLPSESFLAIICDAWKPGAHDAYSMVVTRLLKSAFELWVPFPNQNDQQKLGLLSTLLARTREEPGIIALVKVTIDYCFIKASANRDTHYLLPLRNCLPELLVQEPFLSKFAMDTLQRIAYFPVKSHRVILDYHTVAHPPGPRWRFWESAPRYLHECNAPILQLGHKRVDGQLTARFNNSLFTASFDLLWHYVDRATRSPSLSKGVQSRSILSWLRSIGIIFWRKLRLQSTSTIECHNFTLEMLENPAIVALVEYKWYVLYSCKSMAIIITRSQESSSPLLFVHVYSYGLNWHSSSIYNIVDLAVFGLPLAGSIDQLRIISRNTPDDGIAGLLSFSLFELRVYKSVCQFVTIIIQVILKIRLFFIIFTGGILAFTIATLHLLRSCPFGACKEAESNFSLHFYKALSSTYFFMGGRYDPINDELDSNNWAFHTLMIVYFTFTVILMLNVLIALINTAFDDSDGTWRQVWTENKLQIVESAENMSYDIPGFRQLYNWFPEEVYYSATAREVQNYFSHSGMNMAWEELFQRISGGNNFMVDTVPVKSTSTKLSRTDDEGQQTMREDLNMLLTKHEQRCHEQTEAVTSMKLQMKSLQNTLETQNLLFQKQLQDQLREQQLAHDVQMRKMLEEVTSLFKKI
ncbi:hypothetical protein BGZ51_002417 [Haplosporangium sp. Z 767]|nr:hypothetical protein BGZ51_002417 [Haplosporangium sp. Z 767]